MHWISDRRHRTPHAAIPTDLGVAQLSAKEGGWISLVLQGPGVHDCPICRALARPSEATEAIVDIRRERLPALVGDGWLDDLVELVGRNAIVRVMGRNMEAQPVEVISMETFLARLGYD